MEVIDTSERVEARASVIGSKVREGIEDYKIVEGKAVFRPLTDCERKMAEWAKCLKEGVVIMGDIRPHRPPQWNYEERANFIVTVVNRTGYFILEDVVVHLLSVGSRDGKAKVARETCSPNVIRLHDIRPGGSANTQGPEASWCDGSPQSPPKKGFTLLCTNPYPEGFPGTDTVVASALVTYRATPYFEGRVTCEEPIVGT